MHRPDHVPPPQSASPIISGPYLQIRLTSQLHQILPLPAALPEEELLELARRQVAANRLPLWLILGDRQAVEFTREGDERRSTLLPLVKTITPPVLRAARSFEDWPDVRHRAQEVERVRAGNAVGPSVIMGNRREGGRRATADDLVRLEGAQEENVPRGLEQCSDCHEWRGECLDTNRLGGDWIVQVSCRCENDTRCAACGELFHERRVASNFLHSDGRIVHVVGYVALRHECGETRFSN